MELTYGDYLKIPELLDLQQLRSDAEHDEMLFIVVHQVYELWFKQILHELDQLGYHIDNDELARGEHQLVRILKILKTLVQQIDVLETMTPLEFISFRSFLGSASGFQSAQFREVEFVLGAKDPDVLERFDDSPEQARLDRRLHEPSIWARFCAFLARQGLPVGTEVLERPPDAATVTSEPVQDVLLSCYRTDPLLAGFCELLTDLDEGLQEWRYRHVKMVQRTIGTRHGTGGSDGAAYLRSTLFKPVFPDLWEIRTRF
jgi:tryptophan 2,3-dioxygenase